MTTLDYETCKVIASHVTLPLDMRATLMDRSNADIDSTISGCEQIALDLEHHGFADAAARWMRQMGELVAFVRARAA